MRFGRILKYVNVLQIFRFCTQICPYMSLNVCIKIMHFQAFLTKWCMFPWKDTEVVRCRFDKSSFGNTRGITCSDTEAILKFYLFVIAITKHKRNRCKSHNFKYWLNPSLNMPPCSLTQSCAFPSIECTNFLTSLVRLRAVDRSVIFCLRSCQVSGQQEVLCIPCPW